MRKKLCNEHEKGDLLPTFLLNCILFFAFDACRSLSIRTIFCGFRNSGFFSFFLIFSRFLSRFFQISRFLFNFSAIYNSAKVKWVLRLQNGCVCVVLLFLFLSSSENSLYCLLEDLHWESENFFSLPQKSKSHRRTLVRG